MAGRSLKGNQRNSRTRPKTSGKRPIANTVIKNDDQINRKVTENVDPLPQRIRVVAAKIGGQSALAERLGISKQSLNRWTSGNASVPGADRLAEIAQATGCDPSYLLLGLGVPFPALDPRAEERKVELRAAWDAMIAAIRAQLRIALLIRPMLGDDSARVNEMLAVIGELRSVGDGG